MIWLLIGYMFLFIHRPFEVWPWLGDLRIERIYMLVTIAYWAFAVRRTLVPSNLNRAFLLLGAAIVISSFLSPYGEVFNITVENWLKVAVFYVLVMTSVRDERGLKLLVTGFLIGMGMYIAHSFREYLCGRHVYRMGIARMVGVDQSYADPNTFSATILYSLPMVYPLWYECHKRWQQLAVIGYVGLALACIFLTGSRSAFVGLFLLGGIVMLLSRHRLKLLIAFAVAAPMMWTVLPPELQNRFLTIIDPAYGPENAHASAESRRKGWHDGVRMWKQNSVLGVGPGNFAAARGYDLQSHHLYGQILGELGTVGALAVATVVFCFFSNALLVRRSIRNDPSLAHTFSARVVLAVTVSVVLLLVMGFGGHNLYRYTWLWYGAFQAIALLCLASDPSYQEAEYLSSDVLDPVPAHPLHAGP